MSKSTKSIQLSDETIAEVREAVFTLAEKHLPEGIVIVAVDFERESGHWFLRIYIDKVKGFGSDGAQRAESAQKISLEDCETVSRAVDPELEGIKYLRDFPYTLEVSSPGAFRPLTTAREFEFYRGRPVKVERPDRANSKRMEIITGTLANHGDDTLVLDRDGLREEISLNPHTQIYLNPDIRLPEEGDDDADDSFNLEESE